MFSIIYFLLYKVRLLLYSVKILKKNKLSVPIISIGNLTCGGTGKTPTTIELGKYLLNKGYKVGIISRGYKRNHNKFDINKNILVSDGHEILVDYEICGDEPYLIANKLPKAIVVVNNNKLKACEASIKLGANILILDDGYQYIKLIRENDIVIIDSQKPIDNGYLLPLGLLREPIEEVKRATGIILSNCNDPKNISERLERLKPYIDGKPIISMFYKIVNLKALNIIKNISCNNFNEKVIIVSGIGNPGSFIQSIKEAKINAVKSIEYQDHYNYTFEDMKDILETAQKYNVEDVLTTEKDSIKIVDLCQALPLTFWACETELCFNTEDPFERLIKL